MSAEDQAAADAELRDYVDLVARVQHEQLMGSALKYRGMADFLMQHGRFWTPAPASARFRLGPAQACFANTYDRVRRSKTLRYCEGYAVSAYGFPTHHAWAVRPDGRVLETTWRSLGRSYFGTVFGLDRVRVSRLHRCASVFGLVEFHKVGVRLYAEPFQEGE